MEGHVFVDRNHLFRSLKCIVSVPFSGISCPLGGLWRRGWRRGLWGFIALLLAYFLPAPGKQVDLNGYICPLPGIDVLGVNMYRFGANFELFLPVKRASEKG